MSEQVNNQQQTEPVSEVLPQNLSEGRVLLEDIDKMMPVSLRPFWDILQENNLLLAVVMLIIGIILAKLVQWVFTKVFARLASKTKSEFDDRLVNLFARPVFITVLMVFLMVAAAAMQFSEAWDNVVYRFLLSIMIITWTAAGLRSLSLILDFLSHVKDHVSVIQERTIPLFNIVFKILVVAASAYILLIIWGIDPTAWLASAGIIGVAVGFAAKDTLANLFSGVFIIADAPYKIGDYINLDSGERGKVTHVGLRSTRLLTRDDIEITIPNAVIGNTKIVNESGGPWEKERIRIKVNVAYGSDVDQVVELLTHIADEIEHVVKQPPPRVRLRSFGASGLDFELLCWIDLPVLRGRLSHLLYMAIYKRLRLEGIEIPYTKTDIYVKEMPSIQQQSE